MAKQQNQVAEQQSGKRGVQLSAKELGDFLIAHRKSISTVAQRVMKPERMFSFAVQAATKNPYLLKCDPLTILRGLAECAELGLEANNAHGDAYLVPTWNSKRGCYEAQRWTGYKGMIKLATETGVCKKVEAQVVYDSDPKFDYEYGTKQYLTHKPGERTERSKVIAFYCLVLLNDGVTWQFTVMWKSEVDKIMKIAKANRQGDGPWDTHYDEQGKKTAIRRLFKQLPRPLHLKDERLYKALEAEDANNGTPDFEIPSDAGEHMPEKTRGADALKQQLKGGEPQQQGGEEEPPPVDPETGETSAPTDKGGADLLGDQQQEQPTRARKGGNARDLPATADHLKQVRDKIKSLDLATEAELCRAMGRDKLEGITQGEVIAALTWLDDPAVAYVPPAKPAAQPAKKS